jgi:hypothetical protein
MGKFNGELRLTDTSQASYGNNCPVTLELRSKHLQFFKATNE